MTPLDVSALVGNTTTGPRSILRQVQVFARLAAVPEGQTLSELCVALAMPKTTLFTMLKVLESANYLVQKNGVYRLGHEAILLGEMMAQGPRADFPDCAQSILVNVAERTGETSFLSILTPDKQFCKYVAVVESENWLRYSVKLGSLKPAFATGTGRAMFAFMPSTEVEHLLGHVDFERITENTIASKRALMAALKKVRQRGVSVVDGGTVAGVVSIAAPIFGPDGQVMAAISVGGPTARLSWRQRAVEEAVREAAKEISSTVGYRGLWPINGRTVNGKAKG